MSQDAGTRHEESGAASQGSEELTEQMSIASQDPDAAGEAQDVAREEMEVRAQEPEAKS